MECRVGATSERWLKPLRHEVTVVSEALREEALTAVRERHARELNGELEPLWECESELSRSVQCGKVLLREPD